MIIVMRKDADPTQVKRLQQDMEALGLQVHISQGENNMLMGLVGDTSAVDAGKIATLDIVNDVKCIQEPYRKVSRKIHPENTVVDVNGIKIGAGEFTVIAGPCSVENEAQICEVAQSVKDSGADLLRGGAFKPRTSPYAFQGLEGEGIRLLCEAKKKTGLPIITEIMSSEDIDLFSDVDVIQIGARNMQNFPLLKKVGRLQKPILLKRGLANTIEEWLMSAEYILAEGNPNVILCERGIRTFETKMRNTLDLSAIPMVKKLTHLPVMVDPSHATGIPWMVEPMALAAIAAGADGLMVEVHNDPSKALCDGAQSLRPEEFADMMKKIKKTAAFFKTL